MNACVAPLADMYAEALEASAAERTSRIAARLAEKWANPPWVYDPKDVKVPFTIQTGRNHGKSGLTYAKLKEITERFSANTPTPDLTDAFVYGIDPAMLNFKPSPPVYTRPGTKFVAELPPMTSDEDWVNAIEDDRVLGVIATANHGQEGDVFMGDVSRILTPEFRVSFPKVFKAEAFQEGQEPKYSIVMLFPKKMTPAAQKQFDAMKALAAATAKAKWGDKMPKNLRSPFRDGIEKDLPGYEDVFFVSATSKVKPGLVNENAEPLLPEDFYPGCYAHAYVTCYGYDMAGNRGIAFGLSTIQKTREGEPFSPRNNAQDDFAPVAGGAPSTDADAGIEDIFGS